MIPLIGGLVSLLLVILLLVFGRFGEQRMISDLEDQARVLSHSLEGSVVRGIEDIYGRLRMLHEQLKRDPDMQVLPVDLHQRLRTLVEMTPQLRELAVVNDSGLIIASSVPRRTGQRATGLICSEEAIHDGTLQVTRPLPGRFIGHLNAPAGVYQIPLCMRVDSPLDTSHLQLVAAVNPDAIREQFRPVFENLPARVALYRYDGMLLTALPASGQEPGYRQSMREPFQHLVAERDWGVFAEQLDGRDWRTAYRATSMFPLLLTVSIDVEQALAGWRATMQRLWIGVGIVVVCMLLGTALIGLMRYRQFQMAADLRLLGAAISTTANAVMITDSRGYIRWVNNAFTRLTGYEANEVYGRRPSILNSGEHSKLFFNRLWHTILAGEPWHGEVINLDKQRRRLIVDQTITPILNTKGELTHFVAVHEDITARKLAEQRSLYLANHDSLTGLPNRRELLNQLSRALEADTPQVVALLYIDLDNFKSVNDTLGHGSGDQLLRIAVKRLTHVTGDEICLARLGGDEFAMLLSEQVDVRLAERLAGRILDVLGEPFELSGSRFQISCSIGIALGVSGKSDPQTLLRQSDLAMYRAKQEGRNGYRVFTEEMDSMIQRRVGLEQGLRQALEQRKREFSMRYQPVFDATTLQPVGAEVLLRWQTDSDGWISPAEFIPVAEESGLIIDLGGWQIAEVVSAMAEWDRAGIEPFYLSLNISAVQLARDDVARRLLSTLGHHGISPQRVVAEITETTLMNLTGQVEANLSALETAGIRLSIDDFGTGYSSLGYLRELKAQFLKIDRSFVIGIGKNRSDEEIITAMLAMARSMNMKVIAEGVDSDEQLRFLQQAGCDYIQGFLLARPLPETELLALMQEQRNTRHRIESVS